MAQMSLSFLTAAATRAAATAPATAPQAAMGEAVVAPRPLETRDACCAKYRRIFELRAPSRHAHAHARTALFSLFALSLCLRASPPRLSLCICSAAPLLLSPLSSRLSSPAPLLSSPLLSSPLFSSLLLSSLL